MPRILIVEDEFLVAISLADPFEHEGWEVRYVGNGARALAVLDDYVPDVLITDFMMPQVDGAELIAAVRGDSRLHDMRIVLMSGLPEDSLRPRGIDYDMFFEKPFREDDAVARVRDLMAEGRGA